jgi:hypothetical protein
MIDYIRWNLFDLHRSCYRSLSPISTDSAQTTRVCLNLKRWGSNSGNNFAIFPFDINSERLLIIILGFSFSFDVGNRPRSVISITCHQLLLESRQRGLSRTVKAIAEGSMLSPIHLAQAYVSVRDMDRLLSRPAVAASIRNASRMQPPILALQVQWQRASYCRTQPSRHRTILSLKSRKDPVPDIGVFF